MNKEPMPQVIERFADNGEHSHYVLIDDEGRTLWSEDPDDAIPAPTSQGDEAVPMAELRYRSLLLDIMHLDSVYGQDRIQATRKLIDDAFKAVKELA